MSNQLVELPNRLNELEQKDAEGCDVVIQQVLPNFFVYDGRFKKNILSIFSETDSIPRSWVDHCNTADEVWVASESSQKSLYKSGVSKPIKIVPVPIDTDVFARSWEPLPFRKDFQDDYIFYAVADFNSRKRIDLLIQAFHSEFHPTEQAVLLLKVNSQGLDQNQLAQHVGKLSEDVKAKLRLYPKIDDYRRDIVIAGSISNDDVNRLHISCDCYVSASVGEGWGIPALSAMAFGRDVILPNHSSYMDYANHSNCYLVDCHESNCYGFGESPPELHTARESCWEVDMSDLRSAMRCAYEDRNTEEAKERRWRATETALNYSYEAVGNTILKGLTHNA
jgi:glycosyltransferase involved in cell wall biosynthesis